MPNDRECKKKGGNREFRSRGPVAQLSRKKAKLQPCALYICFVHIIIALSAYNRDALILSHPRLFLYFRNIYNSSIACVRARSNGNLFFFSLPRALSFIEGNRRSTWMKSEEYFGCKMSKFLVQSTKELGKVIMNFADAISCKFRQSHKTRITGINSTLLSNAATIFKNDRGEIGQNMSLH